MELSSSKTLLNLSAAFAGESQARNRYTFYAEKAKEEGFHYLSTLITGIADNEKAHAQVFFNHIVASMGNIGGVKVDADYPFKQGMTLDNMQYALEGELAEATLIYPSFAAIAREEGFEPIAKSFDFIATVERSHHSVFSQLHTQLQDGSFYKRESPVIWRCSHCGYRASSNEVWKICPLCQHPQGYVEAHFTFGS